MPSPATPCRHLLSLLIATLRTSERRKQVLRAGQRLDCALPDSYLPAEGVRVLTPEEQQMDVIRWDLPPLSKAEIRAACAAENRAVWATFTG